jgi:uncharacterized protein (UPF0335 family)
MTSCARCDASATPEPGQALPEGWEEHSSTRTKATFIICGACAEKNGTSSRSSGNVAADQLRLFIERIERIEEDISGLSDDRKDVYGEAKSTGFDTKTMRKVIALRKLDPFARQEADALLETYRASLGLD